MQEKEHPQIQMNLDPNVYAITMVNMIYDPELFHFLIASGNQGRQFAASPKHAKRIYLLLKQQVEAYEKQFGEIITELPKNPQQSQGENKFGF